MTEAPSHASRLRRSVRSDARRVVVLDDDPTGTQSVADVDYVLDLGEPGLRQALAVGCGPIYVLTNTRAHSESEAIGIVREVVEVAAAVCRAQDMGLAIVLRGDSTLRGHVFAEVDALSTSESVTLLVPAFPEAGRVTIDGVHYVTIHGQRLPAASSEYARDPDFAYATSDVAEWVAKVGGERPTIKIPLGVLRSDGPSVVVRTLLDAAAGTVVFPDVETDDDMAVVLLGLLEAEDQGRRVVARGSPSFAALRSGLTSRRLGRDDPDQSDIRLVVCGSFTEGATRQLKALEAASHPAVYLDVGVVQRRDFLERALPPLEEALHRQLVETGLGILATTRSQPLSSDDPGLRRRVMDALVELVRRVGPSCDLIVAKGGITSARIARDALGARVAHVEGQLEPGVARWRFAHPRPAFAFAVVPGNIGDDLTLVRTAGLLAGPSDPA